LGENEINKKRRPRKIVITIKIIRWLERRKYKNEKEEKMKFERDEKERKQNNTFYVIFIFLGVFFSKSPLLA
jgi:hypothetical protein